MARREHRDRGLAMNGKTQRQLKWFCTAMSLVQSSEALRSQKICFPNLIQPRHWIGRYLLQGSRSDGCGLRAVSSFACRPEKGIRLAARVFIHAQTPNRTRHPNPNPITTRQLPPPPRRPKSGGEAPASGSSDDGLLQLQLRRPGCRRRGRRPGSAPRQCARRLHQPRSLRLRRPQKVLPLSYPRRSPKLLPLGL